MKSTDRKILILVASLALLLAGCGGGGSSNTPPPDPGPTPAETAIMQAETALMNAETALEMLGASATDAEMEAAYRAVQQAADNLVTALKANGGTPAAVETATTARQNAMNMADELSQKIADDAVTAEAAMAVLATKLYDGISTFELFRDTSTRVAGYDGDTDLLSARPFAVPVPLKEDKTAMVAPLNGWTGSVRTATVDTGTNAGTYTAHMYGNIEAPTPGQKFSVRYPTQFSAATGVLDTTTTEGDATKVASPSFDHSAGHKAFKLGDNNVAVVIPGSFHGVAGNYECVPGTGNTCAAQVAASGFNLGGVDATNAFGAANAAWTFKPSNPDAMVTSVPDTVYAVYGWWMHEAPDGTFTANVFRSLRGNATQQANAIRVDITALQGTATYRGGAAGLYALKSSTGGTNDAGHFTADAELVANFTGNKRITGTIDKFMGSDGMSRDWSVALQEHALGNTGAFSAVGGSSTYNSTAWTIDGVAASDSGLWSGTFFEQDSASGVPQVATGTFYTTYDRVGRMFGAFGVNLEE